MNDFIRFQISALGELIKKYALCDDNPCHNTGATFKNDVFELKAEYWGDCSDECDKDEIDVSRDCPACAPNFIYKDYKFTAMWYKHVNRSFSIYGEGTTSETVDMFVNCLNSLKTS